MLKEIPSRILNVYLAGIMLGGDLQKYTVDWRVKVRNKYKNWKNEGTYEIRFLDPWNGEIDAEIDAEGLTNSCIPSNLIYAGDKLSIKQADVIVANFNQFGSKRPSVGTYFECGMALAWDKPLVLIVPEDEKVRWDSHPFTAQSVAIYTSVEEFLDSKVLNWFYKRANSAIYNWKI